MSEHFPDTKAVRQHWIESAVGAEELAEAHAEFDRWLAQVKAEARREGWRDCARAIQDGIGAWDALEHYGTEADQ